MYNNFNILENNRVSKYFSDPVIYFNNLVAPPIFSLITREDEMELYKLARSAKSVKLKFKKIDEIMKKYEYFKKIGSGTNRVIYQNLNNPVQVLKIAMDSVALQDAPREFNNQKYLKPFCTKIFEVSPKNVITSSEYVKPIKTYEEFGLYSDMVYDIIIDKFIANGYLLDDIGFSFYANWGIRFDFPVLLDFPYLYKYNDLDQLKCIKTYDGVKCHGYLELDTMLNYLYCPVCGAKDIHLDRTGLKLNNEAMISDDDGIITDGSLYDINVCIEYDNDIVEYPKVIKKTEYIEGLNLSNTKTIDELIKKG